MKKILNIITKLFVLISILGAYALQYFSAHKMGMARHMVYMNHKLAEIISLQNLETTIFVLAVIVFILTITIVLIKKAKIGVLDRAIFALVSIILANELLFLNVDYTVAFYYKLILYAVAHISQSVYLLYNCAIKE